MHVRHVVNAKLQHILLTRLEIVTENNHSYFAQVQGQMYVTGRKWCDFFVYTCNGTFTERICYNDAYFSDIL